MVPLEDWIETLEGSKDARMEFRTKQRVKETIQAAAALTGVDDSAFTLNAAYRAALDTIRAHETTVLAPEDRDVFFSALDDASEPTSALKDAFALHKKMILDDR